MAVFGAFIVCVGVLCAILYRPIGDWSFWPLRQPAPSPHFRMASLLAAIGMILIGLALLIGGLATGDYV
jgi:hypothetical protein